MSRIGGLEMADRISPCETPPSQALTPRERSNITVMVRKRPRLMPQEEQENDVVRAESAKTITVYAPKTRVDMTKMVEPQAFWFDCVFDESSTNDEVYSKAAKPLLDVVLNGGNAVIFAFGQTGSGKTYTMLGNQGNSVTGLYSLAIRDLISHLQGRTSITHKLQLSVSFYEIYGRKLYDLLQDRHPVKTLEDEYHNLNLIELSEHRVDSVASVQQFMRQGSGLRACGSTSANDRSSRSHAVLTLYIKSVPDFRLFGKMVFVDLAGSERAAVTEASDKRTQKEGADINSSLLALKECVRALDKKKKHIPFRGSKLTQVLRDCFVGECTATCMIANVSPCQSHSEDTLNTLRYANRIKELKRDARDLCSITPVPCSNCGGPIFSDNKAKHVCPRQIVQCPHCRAQIDKTMLDEHVAECDAAPTACVFCGLRVVQAEAAKHRKRCGKAPTSCTLCGVTVPKDEHQQHIAKDCPNAQIRCDYCRKEMQRNEMSEHLEDCVSVPVNCPHCQIVVRRAKLEDHVKCCTDNRRSSRAPSVSHLDPLPPLHPVQFAPKPERSPRGKNIRRASRQSVVTLPSIAAAGQQPVNTACRYCGRVVACEGMNEHNSVCTQLPVDCPFAAFGCRVRVRRAMLGKHLRKKIEMHLELVQQHAMEVERENAELKEKMTKYRRRSAETPTPRSTPRAEMMQQRGIVSFVPLPPPPAEKYHRGRQLLDSPTSVPVGSLASSGELLGKFSETQTPEGEELE